jgi:DNA-binding CsgD family transcriptional regulator
MARLGRSDLEALLHAVERTRFVSEGEAFPRVALRTVRELVACDVASFNEVDPEAARAVAVVDPADYAVSAVQSAAFARLAGEHPLIRHYQTGDGTASKLSDFLTVEQFHRTRLYVELYRDLGVEHQIAITLPASLPRVVAIALSRRDADFDERDRQLLNALRPHLAQSYRFAEERENIHAGLEAFSGALRETGTHIVLLDPGRGDLDADTRDLLAAYFGQLPEDGGLPAPVERWLALQPGPGDALRNGDLRLIGPLVVRRAQRALSIRYVPASAGVAALLVNEQRIPSSRAELRLLGLTAREADVLQLLTQGASDHDIATDLGIAYGTVRKHLDNVYRKLGVKRRAQAVALTLELLTERGALSESA